MEILSPAGSLQALKAAVFAGADAVYFGAAGFNARANAENFKDENIKESIEYCHARGVKCYAVINTLILDKEFEQALLLAGLFTSAGIDGFIVQDVGLATLLKTATDVPIHASTQMTVHSLDGVQAVYELGFSRVVLARELSKNDIEYIIRRSPSNMEFEVFVHGALCMCYSGQCYMSSVIGQRSGNRGACAQPCRLPYRGDEYSLSLKDLCLLEHVRELEQIGVCSLKIEGRMKSPEYVAAVTEKYAAAKRGAIYNPEDKAFLADIFSRNGFSDAYFKGTSGKDMFGVKTESYVEYKIPDKEYKRTPVSIHLKQKDEYNLIASFCTEDGLCAEEEIAGEPAKNVPVTEEQFEKAFSKTGNSVYYICDFKAELNSPIFVTVSAMNAARRQALEKITQMRLLKIARFNYPHLDKIEKNNDKIYKKPKLRAFFLSPSEIPDNASELDIIWVPLSFIKTKRGFAAAEKWGSKLGVVLPRIFFDSESKEIKELLNLAKDCGIKNVLVGNIGHIQFCEGLDNTGSPFILHGDFGLNIYNKYSYEVYKNMGLSSSILSFELKFAQLKSISDDNSGIIAYGRLPFMITQNCVAKSCVKKENNKGEFLVDRKGKKFFLSCEYGCRNGLWNADILYLADMDLNSYSFLHLIFTDEKKDEISQIIDEYAKNSPSLFKEGMTRGLYNK